MIRTGIIGFGKMGKTRAKALSANGRFEIVCVHDNDPKAEFEGYHTADSAEEIIKHPDINAIFVCTPNYLNKPLTIAGLDAGKHVFCEKPPAFNAQEVEEIRIHEKASGKKLMYGFNHRHHSSIIYMKNLIDNQELGNILWMRGRYGKSVDQNFCDNWRSKKDLAGGGILLDQGIHMVDLFLYLGGTFDLIHSFVSNLYWKMDIEDNVFSILKNSQTGMVASLHSTMTQWRHLFSLEVFLSRGYMVLNGLRTSSNSYGEESLSIARNRSTAPAATWEDEEKKTYHTDMSWRIEIHHFLDSIENGTPIKEGNSHDALILMQTIDSIYSEGKNHG